MRRLDFIKSLLVAPLALLGISSSNAGVANTPVVPKKEPSDKYADWAVFVLEVCLNAEPSSSQVDCVVGELYRVLADVALKPIHLPDIDAEVCVCVVKTNFAGCRHWDGAHRDMYTIKATCILKRSDAVLVKTNSSNIKIDRSVIDWISLEAKMKPYFPGSFCD
jgi:hypothetical protein